MVNVLLSKKINGRNIVKIGSKTEALCPIVEFFSISSLSIDPESINNNRLKDSGFRGNEGKKTFSLLLDTLFNLHALKF